MKKLCSIDGCEEPVRARGWCATHYGRWDRHGDPLFAPRKLPIDSRFWRKVDTPVNGCWEWMANKTDDGYGRFFAGHRRSNGNAILVLAHRWAYEMCVGPIPDGMCVLHRCDNPPCVNPAHLFLGTDADNVRDCESKGRRNYVRGGKLTPQQVRAIRGRAAAGEQQRALAREFGIPESALSAVVRRRTWKHL